jgi:CO/xanthine dehydrogenase Mo-binding subunit
MTIHASRREVLKGAGALVVSFSFAGAISETLAQGTKPLALTEVDSFLAIGAGGEVTLYSGKVDLGTGVATALPQIVADELDVPLNRIKLIQGDTTLTPDQGPTWGSLSVQIGGMQLRNAAATARPRCSRRRPNASMLRKRTSGSPTAWSAPATSASATAS